MHYLLQLDKINAEKPLEEMTVGPYPITSNYGP